MFHGYVHPQFSNVATALSRQLPKTGNGGAAIAVYHKNELVVDIWGGTKNRAGDPWEKDTAAISWSTTKGIASTLLHICVDKGLLDYDDPVSKHWKAFKQGGKNEITVRQILCHEAGLYDIRSMIDHASKMMDWQHMTDTLATHPPRHPPGSINGYHALTYGWLVGEIIQQVTGQSFSDALQESLVDPLNLDGCYVGIPPKAYHQRADLIDFPPKIPSNPEFPKPSALKGQLQAALFKQFFNSKVARETVAGLAPRGILKIDFNSDEVVSACIPAANGMFTARSLATIYAMLANGGQWQGEHFLSGKTIRQASEVQNRRWDKVVIIPMHWRLGYHRVFTTGPKTPHAFGHFGFGGSGAWCDPARQLAAALTVNSGIGTPFGDSRITRINSAIIRAADNANR